VPCIADVGSGSLLALFLICEALHGSPSITVCPEEYVDKERRGRRPPGGHAAVVDPLQLPFVAAAAAEQEEICAGAGLLDRVHVEKLPTAGRH